MRTGAQSGGFRGSNTFAEAGLGTGGNQTVNAKTGSIPGGKSIGMGDWHPTVVYLLLLLVAEWAAFIWITKYL